MVFGKYINKYYLKYLIFFILGVAALLLVDWVQLYLPEFLGRIVGILQANPNGLNQEHVTEVLTIVVKILIVGVLMFTGRMGWRFALFTTSLNIESNLRDDMFLKAERLSSSYYQQNKVGTVMAWFSNDLQAIEENCGFGIVMIGDAIFLTVFTLFKMFKMNWLLTVIALVPCIFIVIWGAYCEKLMTENWDRRQKSFDALYDYTQENFTGIRVIKAFVKEIQEIAAFKKVARKNYDTNIKFSKLSIILDVILEIIIALIFSLLTGFGGYFIVMTIKQTPIHIFNYEVLLNAEEFVTFTGYFDSLIWPMIALGQIITMRSRAKASLERISNFLDTPEDITNAPDVEELRDCKGNIEFKNFHFTYPGSDHDCLENVNVKINQGEIIGVIGRLGSGKSTLFNSLLRLYNVDEGTLFIDGKDIMKLDFHSVRANVAYCPQDNFLFSSSIKSNIAFANPNGLSDDEIIEASNFSDIHKDIVDFRDKYETVAGERGVTLSGGQKQRISIARAYAKKAPIMILDDSVSAVDVKTEENIIKDIRELRKGQTTIVIASRVSTIRHLDKILVMKKRQVEAFGTHDELMKISPTYQKMVYLQTLEKELNEKKGA